MAKATAALVVGMVAVLIAGMAARIDAASVSERVVVLHVIDYAHVSRGELTEAKQLATEVYRQAGVRAIWTDGPTATARPDDAFHVDVLLLSKDMVAKKSRSDGLAEQVLGRAARLTRRAYIFYDRVAAHAMLMRSHVALLLGAVIAHEVGHVLLPALGHAPFGLMRADWDGPLVRVPSFTRNQGTTMRRLLVAERGHQSRP